MATQPSNNQQISTRSNTGPFSNEVFRPSAAKDTPELSRDNLLFQMD